MPFMVAVIQFSTALSGNPSLPGENSVPTLDSLRTVLATIDLEIPLEYRTTDYSRYLLMAQELQQQGFRERTAIWMQEENFISRWTDTHRLYRRHIPHDVASTFSDLECSVLDEVLSGHRYALTSAFNGMGEYLPSAVMLWSSQDHIRYLGPRIYERGKRRLEEQKQMGSALVPPICLDMREVAWQIAAGDRGKQALLWKRSNAQAPFADGDISFRISFSHPNIVTRADLRQDGRFITRYVDDYNQSQPPEKQTTIFSVYFPSSKK